MRSEIIFWCLVRNLQSHAHTHFSKQSYYMHIKEEEAQVHLIIAAMCYLVLIFWGLETRARIEK